MLSVLTFALIDSVNALLIGVIVGIGVVLPRKYGRTASLLIAGDWLGVFLVSVLCMVFFDAIGDKVHSLVHSPLFGWILIITGVFVLVMAFRGGESNGMVEKILEPLRQPTWKTVILGLILGAVQSLTSAPFYGGLLLLSAGGFTVFTRYITLFLYATLALSLPAVCAIAVGYIRKKPESSLGRGFVWARANSETVTKYAGIGVAAVLVLLGVAHL
ncbi:MAG: hypothetical protein Q4A92_07780 [Corynebacterium sp.]|nr:hypothetical protein [Corynebacterium sp.]